MIDKVMQGVKDDGVLNALVQIPEELRDERTGMHGGPDGEEYEKLRQELVEKYGYSGWYDWSIANWGTKWDLSDVQADRIDPNTVNLTFQTAWAPPVDAYSTIYNDLGFDITAYYYEPGCQFAGCWENGADDYYQDWGDSAGAKATLPAHIDDTFSISENQAEWEAEEEEELTGWIREGVAAREEADES